jgi:hypothetical protein
LNCDPPDLCLLSSWGYRREPPCTARLESLKAWYRCLLGIRKVRAFLQDSTVRVSQESVSSRLSSSSFNATDPQGGSHTRGLITLIPPTQRSHLQILPTLEFGGQDSNTRSFRGSIPTLANPKQGLDRAVILSGTPRCLGRLQLLSAHEES